MATESKGQEGKKRGGNGASELPFQAPPLEAVQPGIPTTHLSTDSTNTLRAFMWIQAMKASLKFTLSQRSRGPCGDGRTT